MAVEGVEPWKLASALLEMATKETQEDCLGLFPEQQPARLLLLLSFKSHLSDSN